MSEHATLGRGDGLREQPCSTASPGPPAKASPSRPGETSLCGPHQHPSASASISAQRAALSANPARAARRAVHTAELRWKLQVRGGEPDPLRAHIVHVGENRRNGADLACRFGCPDRRIKPFDKKLVHAIVNDKDLDRGSPRLSLNFGWTLGHGSLPPILRKHFL